ncbi:MAG: hypothetical protein ABIA04_09810 [Pseudomonadota bacterium]
MRKLITITILSFLFLSISSFAFFDPGFERPILKANMAKSNPTGHFAYTQNIVITLKKLDASEYPTGLDLYYDSPYFCTTEADCLPSSPAIYNLKIQKENIKDLGCGSWQYMATGILPFEYNSKGEVTYWRNIVVTLQDNFQYFCENIIDAKWKATVTEGYSSEEEFDSTVNLLGEPDLIFSTL